MKLMQNFASRRKNVLLRLRSSISIKNIHQDSDLWDFYSLRIGRPGERRLYVFMMTDSDIYSVPYARVANFRLPPDSERAVKIKQLLQMEGFENSGARFITKPREDLVAIVNA